MTITIETTSTGYRVIVQSTIEAVRKTYLANTRCEAEYIAGYFALCAGEYIAGYFA